MSKPGPKFFRSLEHLSGSPESAKHAEQEFVGYDPKEMVSMPRRRFMQLVAAGAALAGAGISGCRRWPEELLVPATVGQRGQMPGEAQYYATALERNGVGEPLIVTSSDGRPTKVEGNGRHPLFDTYGQQTYGVDRSSGMMIGGSDAFAQGSLLDIYDPARRSSGVKFRADAKAEGGEASTWDAFTKAFRDAAGSAGAGVVVISEVRSSPTFQLLKKNFLAKYPQATWVEYEPLTRDAEIAGTTSAFGKPVRAIYDLKSAKTIVSLDCDLVGTHPAKIRHAADWAAGRRSADEKKDMNRLYIAESMLSQTGAIADHRLPVRPSKLRGLAIALAGKFDLNYGNAGSLSAAETKWVDAVASDLKTRGGVVAVGAQVTEDVQAIAHAINAKIASKSVRYVDAPAVASKDGLAKLKDMFGTNRVTALLVLGGNPAFDLPVDLGIAARIASVGLSAHLSEYFNETTSQCKYHLPRSHYLEAWGDVRAFDGTVLLQQPLIRPLYDTKSDVELLALLNNDESLSLKPDDQPINLVKRGLAAAGVTLDDAGWANALHTGFVANTAYAAVAAAAQQFSVAPAQSVNEKDFELRFQQSSQTYDGRYANNSWLLELPDGITKLVWDNAALMNKSDADEKGIKHGDIIKISRDGGTTGVEIPVYVLWGQPRGVIGLPVGFGRGVAGPIGKGVGVNVYPLRSSSEMHYAFGSVAVNKVGGSYELISTQDHQQALEEGLIAVGKKGYVDRVGEKGKSGRVVREGTLAEYQHDPKFAGHAPGYHPLPLLQLYDAPKGSEGKQNHEDAPKFFNTPHAWGMSIDMASCIGCSACIIACQAENNIPSVGKDMVKMNREMHWLRLDRYFKAPSAGDDFENVDIVFQPITCVHCENAPCEQVCPVAATVHDTEGLNTMVYNRCIGTRYCSNNCPYKVRRFNYMDWQSRDPRGSFLNSMWIGIPDEQQKKSIAEVKKMVFNPEVTVRMRGVMEKCTYCTQRIKAATIVRKNQFVRGERPGYVVDDFDVVTACQQACPTQAIVFGDLQNKDSAVSKRHKTSRTYAVLEDLNTRPRTKHMAKLRNPSEALAEAAPEPAPAHT
jgi:molybdopterin-containing oxidoreductase family iron-sulfur binding subunit